MENWQAASFNERTKLLLRLSKQINDKNNVIQNETSSQLLTISNENDVTKSNVNNDENTNLAISNVETFLAIPDNPTVTSSETGTSSGSDHYSQFDDSDSDLNYSSSSTSSSSSSSSDSDEGLSADESLAEQPVLPNETAEVNLEYKQKGKKRKANPDKWKRTLQKRNSGLKYTSSSKRKKVFKAKNLEPLCSPKCRLQCSAKITGEDRKAIFSDSGTWVIYKDVILF
nr:suppressor protein SRP40-like [Onthophagus taurus]